VPSTAGPSGGRSDALRDRPGLLGHGHRACRGRGADAPDPERVGTVTVPVTRVDLVRLTAVDDGEVRLAPAQRVVDVVRPPTPHGEGVGAVPVPVTGERDVRRPAVGEDDIRLTTGDRILHEVRRTAPDGEGVGDRKSTRLNSSHVKI